MHIVCMSSACIIFFISTPLYTHYPQCITQYLSNNDLSLCQTLRSNTIVLWVHGTRFMINRGFKSVFNKKSQLKNALELTHIRYYRNVIDTLSERYGLSQENVYFFGWNGKLSNKERKKSAPCLYDALLTLKKQYEKKNTRSPEFIVIGHSHGGNVILHMAAHHKHNCSLTLDKVVLLACPAQDAMYHCLQSSLFKKIYVLYSYQDMIQTLAPNFLKHEKFSLKNINFLPFSKRLFPHQDNIVQAQIIINGTGLHHNDFVRPPFLTILPSLLNHMDNWVMCDNQTRFIADLSTNYS